MDALEILGQMHVEAKSAFQQIEQASPEKRAPLWAKLGPELKLHEQVEEQFVYDPAATALAEDQMLQEWHTHHHEEVGQAEQIISKINGMQAHDDEWLHTVKQLNAALEQHIQKEEAQIWPHIREVWGDHLVEAGEKIQAEKTGATRRAA